MDFKQWAKEQDRIWIEQQRNNEDLPEYIRKSNSPYYGAIGGGLSSTIYVDKNKNFKKVYKHATGSTYETEFRDLNEYTKSYFEKFYIPGHEYEISEFYSSIGLFLSIKNLTLGEEINNYDDI